MEPPPPPPEDHSFTPANHKLISVYLRRRVAGEPLPPATAAHFHDIDIYAAEPTTLTAGLQPLPAAGKGEWSSWLFFTPVRSKSSTDSRKSRKVGGGLGTWHSEHAPEAVIDDQGNRVGYRQLFSYKEKGGKRSGWSMWEFTAADHESGESPLVLCKIHHQAHASSRHGADGSAARSARKRKGMDNGVDQARSAPVKRRLFAPPAPTPPSSASQDEITAASEAIPCSRTETKASKDKPMSMLSFWDEPVTSQDKIGAASEVIPSSRSEVEASKSKDTPRSMLSFWDQPAMSQDVFNASFRSSVRKRKTTDDGVDQARSAPPATPPPAASQDEITAASEAIPGSTTETEASQDTPMSVLSFWDEAVTSQDKIGATSKVIHSSRCEVESSKSQDAPRSVLSFWNQPATLQDIISASLRSVRSFTSNPDASQQTIIGTVTESPASFLIAEPEASQGMGMATFESGFLMDSSAPPAPEHCYYHESFTNGSNISGLPFRAPVADSWTGYDTTGFCSGGNPFLGGLPLYNNTASCYGGNAIFGSLPTFDEWGIPGSAGVQYGSSVPSAPFLPSAAPSQWRSGPNLWSCSDRMF